MALELKIISPSPEGFVQEIVWNADEIATEVAAKVGYYKNLVYTEDQVVEAKKDRAQLNKFIAALKAKDREIKDLCLKPYDEFHSKMLKIISLVEEPARLIDTQVKDFEDKQKREKKAEIRKLFDAKGFQPWVTPERIWNPKWLNKSYSLKQIDADLTSIQHKIGEDILLINGQKEGMQAALSEYKRTMDVTAAMAAAQRYMEVKRAEDELKKQVEEQKQSAAQMEGIMDDIPFGMEPEDSTQMQMNLQAEIPTPAPNPGERREKAFKVFVTRDELIALNRFLQENGYIFRQINI